MCELCVGILSICDDLLMFYGFLHTQFGIILVIAWEHSTGYINAVYRLHVGFVKTNEMSKINISQSGQISRRFGICIGSVCEYVPWAIELWNSVTAPSKINLEDNFKRGNFSLPGYYRYKI